MNPCIPLRLKFRALIFRYPIIDGSAWDYCPPECFIVTDLNGEKEIFNIRDYDTITKANHNIRDRYIKGVYGGIPITGYFDFEDLIDILTGDNYE